MRGGMPGHPAPAPSARAGPPGAVSRGRQCERMTESRHPAAPISIGPDAARLNSTVPRLVGGTRPALVDEATVEQRRVAIVVAAPGGGPVIVALWNRLARREQGATQDDNDDG